MSLPTSLNAKLISGGFNVVELIHKAICLANPGFQNFFLPEDLEIVRYSFYDDSPSSIEIRFRRKPRIGGNNSFNTATTYKYDVVLPSNNELMQHFNIAPEHTGPVTQADLTTMVNLLSGMGIKGAFYQPSTTQVSNKGLDPTKLSTYRRLSLTLKSSSKPYVTVNGLRYNYPEPINFIRNTTLRVAIYTLA